MKITQSILILFLINGCSNKNLIKTNHEIERINELTDTITINMALSLDTKIFILDWNSERLNTKNDVYIPSDNLIIKYGLQKQDNKYIVDGIIKVDQEFNPEKLNKLGIICNTKAENIYTISIPLNSLEKFLRINGIEYFEIAKKTEIKNNHNP